MKEQPELTTLVTNNLRTLSSESVRLKLCYVICLFYLQYFKGRL